MFSVKSDKKGLVAGGNVQRSRPLNEDEIHQGGTPFLRTTETVGDSFLYEVRNAYVSPYGVVFKNGRAVKESFLHAGDNVLRQSATFYKKMAAGKTKSVSGRCLVIHNVFYDNYYHWTLECLPRLFCVREEAKSLKLLIHERLLPFHAFYLGLFDFREIVLIKDDELVQAETVVFPSHVTPGLVPPGQVISDLSAYVFGKLQLPAAQPVRNVFISREKARYRHAVNEPEVWAAFKNCGFEKVWLEDLSVADQVRLLSQTRRLSGIHGAGFSNMLYMQRGERFMDLMHKDYRSNGFYNLASIFNIGFVLLQCEGTGRSKDPRTDDLRVPVPTLEKYLEAYFA